MSWVYFIQHGGPQGHIKIGTTSGSPHARLRALQTGAPEPLRLLAAIPGGSSLEHELHQKFKACRVRPDGEWFRAEESLVWFINGIQWATDDKRPVDDGEDEETELFGVDGQQVLAIVGAVIGYMASIDLDLTSMGYAQGMPRGEALGALHRIRLLDSAIGAVSGTDGAMAKGAEWAELGLTAERADEEARTISADPREEGVH
jgi:hypothetical protein